MSTAPLGLAVGSHQRDMATQTEIFQDLPDAPCMTYTAGLIYYGR